MHDSTVIKLDPELGRRLKLHCVAKGVSMRDFVSSLVLAALVAVVPETLPQDPGAATGMALRKRPAASRLHRRHAKKDKPHDLFSGQAKR